MRYIVSCDHDGCEFSTSVDFDEPVPDWRAPVSVIRTHDGDGNELDEPEVDAYATHHQQVHAPQGQPPMLVYRPA
jgi:hypothetical protein